MANKFLGVAAAASKKFGVGSAISKLKAGAKKKEKDEAKVEEATPAAKKKEDNVALEGEEEE